MRRLLVLLMSVPLLALAPPAGAQEVCDKFVRAKGKKWVYQGSGVKCDTMHEAVKLFLREGDQPPNFKCTRVRTRGVCSRRRGKDGTFVFYERPKQRRRSN